MPEARAPLSPQEITAIREQLEHLLIHPLFANSRRYPALLAYTVEQTLRGNSSELKERTIGAEVFGRSPTYDANADPVVRITAGEVRKRLTQYYYDPAHAGQLVIELPLGSYIPLFHLPGDEPKTDSSPLPPSTPVHNPLPPPHIPRLVITAIVVLACAAGVGIGLELRRVQPPSAMDRFWTPIASGDSTATYCLGEPSKSLDPESVTYMSDPEASSKPEPLYFSLHSSGHLALADVITLTLTTAALQTRHKAFRVLPASEASFAQLREGPIVLIGGFDNVWTLRITRGLRFGFESKNGVALVVDRKDRKQTTWATAWSLPYQELSRDYGIVARIHDGTTGQPVVIAAGISEEGTEAAGEMLYNPAYLDLLLAKAPPDWEQMNMEAVIETQVIDGHPGPPRILAFESW